MVGDGELVSELDHNLLSFGSVFDRLRGSGLTDGAEFVARCEAPAEPKAPDPET